MLSVQSFSLECVQFSRASDNVVELYFILLRIWQLELTVEIFCSGSAGMCLSQLLNNISSEMSTDLPQETIHKVHRNVKINPQPTDLICSSMD